MVIIGICGASGSGKTLFAKTMCDTLKPLSVPVLPMDSYYYSYGSEAAVRGINFDKPDAFNMDLLISDIEKLKNGKSITRRHYDYVHHVGSSTSVPIYPPKVMIVEGIHAFDPRLIDYYDIKLYMDIDIDICLIRRIVRDSTVRGRSVNSIAEQYVSNVRPMFDAYIRNYKELANLCITGGGNNKAAAKIVTAYVHQLLDEGK